MISTFQRGVIISSVWVVEARQIEWWNKCDDRSDKNTKSSYFALMTTFKCSYSERNWKFSEHFAYMHHLIVYLHDLLSMQKNQKTIFWLWEKIWMTSSISAGGDSMQEKRYFTEKDQRVFLFTRSIFKIITLGWKKLILKKTQIKTNRSRKTGWLTGSFLCLIM